MLAKKLPLKRSGRLEFHTYSINDNMVRHALVGRWGPRLGKVMMGNIAELELKEHRIRKELADLNLSKTARSRLYGEGMMTKFMSQIGDGMLILQITFLAKTTYIRGI